MRIQAHWRGYTVRRDIALHTSYWLAAGIIQSAWRRYIARRDEDEDTPRAWDQMEMVAATKIQVSEYLVHSCSERT